LSGVQIVPYEPKYLDAFRKLNQEWITTYFKMEKPDHDALDHPKEYILDHGGFIFVALLGGEPVGVCASDVIFRWRSISRTNYKTTLLNLLQPQLRL
jgi:hypothetical protein